MKIAVIGGGSSYTPELLKGLVEISSDVGLEQVWLHDLPGSEKLDVIHGFATRFVGNEFEVFKTNDFYEAVKDASYVIFQFRPGGLKGRELDESIPLKYGLIGQETTGVGGFAAALRAFPMIEEYVNSISDIGAWIISFTNPSGHITEFVLNYLGYDRFVGLCNIPINILKSISEIFGVDLDDVFVKYYGINHLTFLERVFVGGQDVTSRTFELLDVNPANIPTGGFETDLIKSLGLFPNPYLRYYLMEGKMYEKISGSELRSRQVMEIEKELMEIYRRSSDIPPELSKRGGSMYSTAASLLLRDLHLGNGKFHVVNTKNLGAVSDLPEDYVLEIPVYTRGGEIFPVSLGKSDDFAKAFIHSVKMYERLTVEAYLERSKGKLVKALLVHPLGPDADIVEDLLDDILSANSEWIVDFS